MGNKKHNELVIEGPFLLVKGFLCGFASAYDEGVSYFFHRKSGIRRETMMELVKEWFEFENYVHLCLDAEYVNSFTKQVEKVSEQTGMKIRSNRPILSASFQFEFEIHNREMADKARELIKNLPSTVSFEYFKDHEDEDSTSKGVEMYSPAFEYTYSGKGKITGDFHEVSQLYLRLKRSELINIVNMKKMELAFE